MPMRERQEGTPEKTNLKLLNLCSREDLGRLLVVTFYRPSCSLLLSTVVNSLENILHKLVISYRRCQAVLYDPIH